MTQNQSFKFAVREWKNGGSKREIDWRDLKESCGKLSKLDREGGSFLARHLSGIGQCGDGYMSDDDENGAQH